MHHRRSATIGVLLFALSCLTATAQSSPTDSPVVATASRSSVYLPSYGGGDPYPASEGGNGVMLAPPPRRLRLVDRREPLSGRPFSTFAVGVTVNSLGYGVEVATPLSRSINLRAGGNLFTYAYPFAVDGVNYQAQINFRSGQASLDWSPFHGSFHIGPGVVYYNNGLVAALSVPSGKNFSLGDMNFTNSITDPVHGTANITYPKRIAPALIAGFGNILPRSGRRFSMPVEFGVAYMGAAQIKLNLQGTACQTGQCFNMATDPDYQYSLLQEQNELNEDLKKFRIYPIFSTGIAYRF